MTTGPQSEPYDAGDASQVDKRRKGAKFARDTELSELRHILNTDGGRSFLWRLLAQCHMGKEIDSQIDEGKRRVGLWLVREIEAADPRGYLKILDHALTKEQSA